MLESKLMDLNKSVFDEKDKKIQTKYDVIMVLDIIYFLEYKSKNSNVPVSTCWFLLLVIGRKLLATFTAIQHC